MTKGSGGPQAFGFGAKSHNGHIRITCIHHDGLLEEWNAQNPSRQVRPGDMIVAVNGYKEYGKFGISDFASMLLASPTIELEVVRKVSNRQTRTTTSHDRQADQQVLSMSGFPPLAALSQRTATECSACECVICCEDLTPDAKVVELSCKHAFHPHCIGQWMERGRDTCPLCRVVAWRDFTPSGPQATWMRSA
jgi:hypothetical protein